MRSSKVLICRGSVDLYLLSAEKSGAEFAESGRLSSEVSGQEQPLHLHHLVWLLSPALSSEKQADFRNTASSLAQS